MYDNVDMFAGAAGISRAFRAAGFSACALDLSLNPKYASLLHISFFARCVSCIEYWLAMITETMLQDILSAKGFLAHVWAILSCRVGALVSLGVPCSSWVSINRPLAA